MAVERGKVFPRKQNVRKMKGGGQPLRLVRNIKYVWLWDIYMHAKNQIFICSQSNPLEMGLLYNLHVVVSFTAPQLMKTLSFWQVVDEKIIYVICTCCSAADWDQLCGCAHKLVPKERHSVEVRCQTIRK